MATRFYAGYLLGFPNYVALHDDKVPGAIRKGLLGMCHGNELPRLMKKIEQYLTMGDPQLNAGLEAGAQDGQRFFKSVEINENLYGEETCVSLERALLTRAVNFNQTL
jgi:hypothetical protein